MSEYRPELFVKKCAVSMKLGPNELVPPEMEPVGVGPEEAARPDRDARLVVARQTVSRIERRDRAASLTGPILASGIPDVDAALPRGGFSFGGMHELLGLGARRFAVHLLRERFAQTEAPALWITPAGAGHSLYGPGLARLGVDPNRLVIARARTTREALWSLEEALKSGAFALILGELDAPIGQTAARRLQLAAEAGVALGLLLSEGRMALSAPGSVTSRWQVDPAPACQGKDGIERRLSLTLERHRGLAGGAAATPWTVGLV